MTEKYIYEKAINFLNILLKSGLIKIPSKLNELKAVIEELNGLMYEKVKRSKNSNSYAWVLITKIANEMKLSKEEVYLEMLKSYGQSMFIPVSRGKKPDGYFKYFEFNQEGVLNGKECDWYKVYKGSSDFTQYEMNIFLNGIVQECQNIGIPTYSKEDIESLIRQWDTQKTQKY